MALDMEVMGEAVQTRSWSCWYSSASTGECETLSWSTATARFLETAKFRWAKNKYTLRVTAAHEIAADAQTLRALARVVRQLAGVARSFATWLNVAGVNVKDTQALMRHAHASTTQDIYQQMVPESQR